MAKNGEKYEAFAPVVCERLRRLRDRSARYRRQRDKQFKARDAADAGLNETQTSEKTKRDRLLSDYGEAVRKIKDLDAKIREAEKAIDETIEYADQGELFNDPDSFTPPAEESGDEVEEDAETEPASA